MKDIDLWNLTEEQNEIAKRWLSNNSPAWANDLTAYDIAAINQGGCASGAYMPAVTNHIANETMAAHGDDVLQYIKDDLGDLPPVPLGLSWSGMGSFFLANAAELFALNAHYALTELLRNTEDG